MAKILVCVRPVEAADHVSALSVLLKTPAFAVPA